jgi:hypothetical protein
MGGMYTGLAGKSAANALWEAGKSTANATAANKIRFIVPSPFYSYSILPTSSHLKSFPIDRSLVSKSIVLMGNASARGTSMQAIVSSIEIIHL